MKLLTNIATIMIIIVVTVTFFSNPTVAFAQADEIQAAGTDGTNIVGGEMAEQGEWGWQVLVRPGNYLCGGSLIDANWVLTAAHCVTNNNGELFAPASVKVTVGDTDRSVTEGTEQTIAVDALFVHENYNEWNNNNDIALLHLATPVVMNSAIKIVPMLTDAQLALAAPGELATVTGWGATAEGGFASRTLMEVSVPVVSNEICNNAYGIISDNMICAGYVEGGKDSCQGDSGGPLVVPDEDGNWYLAGIVSFGYGCARENFYGVYTRVSQYADWVQTLMEDNQNLNGSDTNSTVDENGNVPEDKDNSNSTTNSTTKIVFLPVVMN